MIVGDIHDYGYSEKMQRCQVYIDALEEERRKILVFQRELPLCLELVTQAIEACKQQLSGTTTTTEYLHGQSECNSEQTTSDGPAFEEFIPIKKSSSSDDDEQESHKSKSNVNGKSNETCLKKSDWLGSAQLSLWNQTPDPPTKEVSPRKVPVAEVKRNGSGGGGAFHPFKREKSTGTSPTPMATASPSSSVPSTAADAGRCSGSCGANKEDKDGPAQRKARRSWSPELHRRFLQALQQLGGSHVATPKQIRELMKVDGLTNDEVKSHLQKYRLHARRPSPSIHNKNNPQEHQFVVVGGIWVPPPEYAASGDPSAVTTPNRIYAPIAAPAMPDPQTKRRQQQQQHKPSRSVLSDERGSHIDGGSHSNSPATSSSTHTTTASPAC